MAGRSEKEGRRLWSHSVLAPGWLSIPVTLWATSVIIRGMGGTPEVALMGKSP